MIYTRVDLEKTNYKLLSNFQVLSKPDPEVLEDIYNQYCIYKKFESVMPIFPEEYTDSKNDVIGYYNGGRLVAFSLTRKYNDKNVEAIQFAWDYENPLLKLGIESLKSECALYKKLGYKYYYLGESMEYKKQIDGFEVLGPRI